MRDVRAFVRREIARLGLPDGRERKVVEEYSAHVEDMYAALLDEGLSDDEAWEEVQRRIPEWAVLRNELLDTEPILRMFPPPPVCGVPPSDDGPVARIGRHIQDARLEWRTGLRHLWRSRGYALATVVTLAVCLGANAAIFSVVNRLLLHPLSVPEPSRILVMANRFPNSATGRISETSAPRNYFDRRRGVSAFSEQAMFAPVERVIASAGQTAQWRGIAATPSLFRLLGVPVALGRAFTDEEGEVGHDTCVVLSHELWQELYAGAPGAVGAELRVNGRPFTVVGVMPAQFSFFDPNVRFWIPLAFTASERTNPIANNWYNIGRLAPGATREQAQAQVDSVNAEFLDAMPRLRDAFRSMGYHTTVEPMEDVLVRGVRRVLYLLWGGALAVLFVGAVNLANLTLAHTQWRTRDLATRMALGAGRVRVGLVLMVESLAIAIVGGLLGLFVGAVGLDAMRVLVLDGVMPRTDFEMGLSVVAFVMALAVVTGLLIGLVPVAHLRRLTLATTIRFHDRGSTYGRGGRGLRRGLIVVQVACTLVVVAGAGAFAATVTNLLSVDPGFTVRNVLTAAVTVPAERYANLSDVRMFVDRIVPEIRDLPGVTAAAVATAIPLGGRTTGSIMALGGGQPIVVEGQKASPDEALVTPAWIGVTPGFFDAMGTRLLRGRDFEDRDSGLDASVIIVDETLARRFWPAGDPIGKRLFLPGIRNVLQINDRTRWLTIVGVAPDLVLDSLADRRTAGVFYTPYTEANANNPPRRFGFVVRTPGDPVTFVAGLRRALAEIDPELALFDVHTMADRVSLSLTRERLAMYLASAFGGIALILAALGIYGVLSFLVAQRTRELGIRIVLGSTPAGVMKFVLREGLALVAVGLLIGVVGTFGLGPVFASQVYGVRLTDPFLVGGAAVALVVVALVACASPARRAARVDPLIVLNDGV